MKTIIIKEQEKHLAAIIEAAAIRIQQRPELAQAYFAAAVNLAKDLAQPIPANISRDR